MKYSRQNTKAGQEVEKLKKSIVLRRLLAITLSVGGAWLIVPMLASAQTAPLTPAGTAINNTATGTYQDPNNPGTSINTTSNTVTATVAAVAGVTVASSGTVDINGGSITTNDGLNYNFLITNVGNQATDFHIPTAPTIVGGTLGTTGANIPVANQLGANVYVTSINGVTLPTPVALPASGLTTDPTFLTAVQSEAGFGTFNGTIPANGTLGVTVPVTVNNTDVAGNPVTVTLGNSGLTAPNTQNQPDAAPATTDVYTVTPTVAQVPGVLTPVNGTRQATGSNTQIVATQITNLALATVLKTRLSFVQGTPSLLNYRLDLRVESNPPAAGITPAPLLGTTVPGQGAPPQILISDAVPVGTTISNSFFTAPLTVTINGVTWTKVYSTVATTVGPLDVGQNWQTATTTIPGLPVTRIGFITAGPLAPGSTTVTDANGLQVQVSVPAAFTGNIANIAQVFGQTTAGAIGPTNPLVYDASGDQNPDDYRGGVAPTPITNPTTAGGVPTGVANPTNDGTDTNNNNTGTAGTGAGSNGGADNVYTISPLGTILNGPNGQPTAIGPDTTNQTDFTNKSDTSVPAGATTGTAYTPATVTFTNTVQNPSTNAATLNNVTLEPISPTLAAEAVNSTTAPTAGQIATFNSTATGNSLPLPNGTTVTVTYGNRTTTYTYAAGTDSFALTSSTTGGAADGTATPIIIPALAVGSTQNYTVAVTMPANSGKVNNGYSVPVVAYVNSNTADGSTFKSAGNGTAATTTTLTQDGPFNITIDREYTGYLTLLKQSQVLQGTGPAVQGTDGTLSTTPKTPASGNIIVYQITYTNISSASTGSGNTILNAGTVVITEDGATAPNNWATTTLNVAGSATDAFSGSVITFFNNGTASTTTDTGVTKYLDSIPTVAPNASGTFSFQRQVK